MNIYLLSRPKGSSADYDEYNGAVVIAASEYYARKMHPGGEHQTDYSNWIPFDQVVVTLLGVAVDHAKQMTVLSSYRAG